MDAIETARLFLPGVQKRADETVMCSQELRDIIVTLAHFKRAPSEGDPVILGSLDEREIAYVPGQEHSYLFDKEGRNVKIVISD